MTTAHKSAKNSERKPRKPVPDQEKGRRSSATGASAKAASQPRGKRTFVLVDWDVVTREGGQIPTAVELGSLASPDLGSLIHDERGNLIGARIAPATHELKTGMQVRPAIYISTKMASPSVEEVTRFLEEAATMKWQTHDHPISKKIEDVELLLLQKVLLRVEMPDLERHVSVDINKAVTEWARMLPMFVSHTIGGQEDALRRAALAYQPQTQLRPVDLELLEMQKNAAEAILSGTRWMTAAEVSQEANRSKSNPHALANRWKKEGRVFAIKYQGIERYPRYAFDKHMAPLPVIADVLKAFAEEGDEVDPWDIAAWFESSNAYLDSARPRECLDDPSLVRYASERLHNMMHG